MSPRIRLPLARLWLGLALALHAVVYLGLYQVEFSAESRARLAALTKEEQQPWHRIKAAYREFGIGGLVAWYLDEIDEVKLYYGHARLALAHDATHLLEPPPRPLPPEPRVYRDVPLEYQPGALLQFIIPALVTHDYTGYKYASAAWYALLHVGTLLLGLRLLHGGWPGAPAAARAAGWSLLFLLCFGKLAAFRFDHAVPFFIVLALAVLARATQAPARTAGWWHAAFGLAAAAGALTKITPGLVVPAAWIVLAWRGPGPATRQAIAWQAAGLVAGLGGLSLWFHLWFGHGYWASFAYHATRGVQLESLYAGFAAALHPLGLPAETAFRHGAWEILDPLNPVLLAAAPLLFLGFLGWTARQSAGAASASPVVGTYFVTLALLTSFILTNKVFSPQFLLWIGPLFAAATGFRADLRGPMLLLCLVAALTQAIYPPLYSWLRDLHPAAVALLNLRNLLFAALAVWLIRRLPALLARPDHDFAAASSPDGRRTK